MNWKVATFTVISIILYAYILVCFGLAGQYTQHMALVIGACVLKYGLILFGFFIAGFLPYRINTALKKRKDALSAQKQKKTCTKNSMSTMSVLARWLTFMKCGSKSEGRKDLLQKP